MCAKKTDFSGLSLYTVFEIGLKSLILQHCERRFQHISLHFDKFRFLRFLVDFEVFWGRFSNSVLSWKSVLKGKNIPCANAINPDTIITTGHEFSELYRRQGNFHLSFFLPSLALCSFAYGFFGSINLCLTCCRDP